MSYLHEPSRDDLATDEIVREADLRILLGSRARSSINQALPCRVILTRYYLKYAITGQNTSHHGDAVVIPWHYVIGCHCDRQRKASTAPSTDAAFIVLYVYGPQVEGRTRRVSVAVGYSDRNRDIEGGDQGRGQDNSPAGGEVRWPQRVMRRCKVEFVVVGPDNSLADNLTVAKELQATMLTCIYQSPVAVFSTKRRYLVLVNPHSGPGRAYRIFMDIVNPIFAEADITYDLIITTRANHAYNEVRHRPLNDLASYRGIVVVSGDGLVHEVFNGLAARPDAEQALVDCPVGVVAAGSGNALAAALCHHSGVSCKVNLVQHNSLFLVAPLALPLDLCLVETGADRRRRVSFLSITWGLVADIDIGSERLRALGAARFTLAALGFIIKLRTYSGQLSYLPTTATPTAAENSRQSSQGHVARSRILSTPGRIQETQRSEDEEERLTGTALGASDSNSGVSCSRDRLLASPNGDDATEGDPAIPVQPGGNVELGAEGDSDQGADNVAFTFRYLPPLDSPLPPNWQTIRGQFVTICAVYQTHLGTDTFIAPRATFDDGVIYLFIIRAGVTRIAMLNILMALEKGEHNDSPDIMVVPVRAFRLIPDPPAHPPGIMTIDGERVPYGPVQAEVMPRAARLLGGVPAAANRGQN